MNTSILHPRFSLHPSRFNPTLLLGFLAIISTAVATPLTGKGVIKIEREGSGFVLKRDGKPYYVKGIGGQKKLEVAAEGGANSTRTWGSEKAIEILDEAKKLGMTATVGVWLDHKAAKYHDETYKERMRAEVKALVQKIKDHPALLFYALGNETNSGADTPEAWAFINELAEFIHKEDSNHPVMTVLAGSSTATINKVAQYAPAIDILGINSYRGIVNAPRDVDASEFKGPYLVTEWGPYGHWEVGKTSWGAPLEQTSEEKAAAYLSSYEMILKDDDRCLGSYVFLWGQKQERTPTWYGMFLEENPKMGLKGESVASVDVMTTKWSGKAPANRAPMVTGISLSGHPGQKEAMMKAGEKVTVELAAKDPDGDKLTYVWEVLPEASKLGSGGSFEPRPESLAGAIKDEKNSGEVTVEISKPGNYRIFGYALDGKGKAGTANLPVQVR